MWSFSPLSKDGGEYWEREEYEHTTYMDKERGNKYKKILKESLERW